MFIGFINFITGVSVGILSPIIGLLIIIIILPLAMIMGAIEKAVEYLSGYFESVKQMLQYGYKLGDKGLKRMKGQTNDR